MEQHEYIKQVAVNMVVKSGLINLSKNELCKQAGIPRGSFNYIMNCTFLDLIEELKNDDILSNTPEKVIKTRTDPTLRKDQILKVAVDVAKECGCHRLTRVEIALRAGVSVGLITHYFNTMTQLKRAVMRAAIQQEILEIIAQGLKNNDVYAKKASEELKIKALKL